MYTIYAEANYRVYGTGYDGKPYETTVHATLEKSGAFEYGNGTCMVLKWADQPAPHLYDTRYCDVSAENFTEFARRELEAQTLDTIHVEVI
jgi:hypothetical protein